MEQGKAPLCAIYTRLSKEDEEKRQSESESIQNQKALLAGYAAERGWDVYRVYCDEDYSGADRARPDFRRMIEAAEKQKFQIILCKSQSRFTRDMELVEKYIHTLFPLWGIRFIAVADNADTEIRGNKKARQINGLVNEWYLEDLSENIRMVLDMKRRQGQYIGGCPLYGYQKDPNDKNHLVVEPETAEVVRKIFRWALAGYGKQRIAQKLNDEGISTPARCKAERMQNDSLPAPRGGERWNKTTVWRILHNEMYIGNMAQGRSRKINYKSNKRVAAPREQWFRVAGTHEAIIDAETFYAVQKLMALRTRADGTGTVHPLAGLVKCMDCGSTMSKCTNGRRGEKQIAYLRCKQYAESGARKRCSRHSVRLEELTELVLVRMRQYVQRNCAGEEMVRPKREEGMRDALTREKKELERELNRRERALENLYLDKVSGVVSAEQFAAMNGTFLAEKGRMKTRWAAVVQELQRIEATRQDTEEKEIRELLELKNLPRELAAALIEKIEVGEKDPNTGEQRVRICWKF